MSQNVYAFTEGHAGMRDLLGGKGANLAELCRLGLPVPQGFTITTQACLDYLKDPKQGLSTDLKTDIQKAIQELEAQTHKQFNQKDQLLLVSVRSGAKISMPGMMDTILNVGLNDENVEALAQMTDNPHFAYDCYRRLLQMYADVVYGLDSQLFEDRLSQARRKEKVTADYELSSQALRDLVADFKTIYQEELNFPFPQDVHQQIYDAVEAVFKSWNNKRARVYRQLHDIPDDLGTAVNIQEMVFGNLGPHSGTGVLFTRHPASGEKELFGEFLVNAQGEDVVAGIRTPQALDEINQQAPQIYQEIESLANKLEAHYHNMQDIEFTIEEGKLYFLQTRDGKRTAKAAVKIAVDMVKEGLITKAEALQQVDAKSLDQLLHPSFTEENLSQAELLSEAGLAASPGAASGAIVFTADKAKDWAEAGKACILVRQETSPEDIEGMTAAQAILTCHGGMTSHAAVVARGMGKCCVTGCHDLNVDEGQGLLHCGDRLLHEGDSISVDGNTGKVYLGHVPRSPSKAGADFEALMTWAREESRLAVRMNAENPQDIQTGFDFKAQGIGLVRTEHMFFQAERLLEIRRFILSSNDNDRHAALERIAGYQEADFKAIFDLSQGQKTVIRLLDPPLHEFLPQDEQEILSLAQSLELSEEALKDRIQQLKEVNPMLGHRGCRLAMTYPELYEMQVHAILAGSRSSQEAGGQDLKVEIMIPLVSLAKELQLLKQRLEETADRYLAEHQMTLSYKIGTMIEIPRACLTADQIAQDADFMSFGTNDLTQMTFGYSRDDAGKFIHQYLADGTLAKDPFQSLDQEGVGALIKLACQKARSAKPDIPIGVCGEVAGDPASIAFFDAIGLDYISCSPFRLPIAQLAAAQASLLNRA